MKKCFGLLFLLAVFATSTAFAQAEKIEKPCKADVKKFCKGIKPGEGRISKCLLDHKADVAPACIAKIEKADEAFKDWKLKCGPDVRKFCKDVKPGAGRVLACLVGQKSNLAAECRGKVDGVNKKYDEWKAACGADAEKYCKEVKPGKGRIAACLKGRQAGLSDACKARMGWTDPAADED
jgi:hypothetical protein